MSGTGHAPNGYPSYYSISSAQASTSQHTQAEEQARGTRYNQVSASFVSVLIEASLWDFRLL